MTKQMALILIGLTGLSTFAVDIGIRIGLRDDPAWKATLRERPNKVEFFLYCSGLVVMAGIWVTYLQTRERSSTSKYSAASRLTEGEVSQRLRDAQYTQLVGGTCLVCGRRIVSDLDAIFCGTCKRPVHLACKRPGDGSTACVECGCPIPV
jgi:hypothetical protein